MRGGERGIETRRRERFNDVRPVTVGDLDLRAYGWLLPYKVRSVSGFEVIVDGHSAPAVWQQHASPDVAKCPRLGTGKVSPVLIDGTPRRK